MKLIDLVIIFYLLFILVGIADRFLKNLMPSMRQFGIELEINERGILYLLPENKG